MKKEPKNEEQSNSGKSNFYLLLYAFLLFVFKFFINHIDSIAMNIFFLIAVFGLITCSYMVYKSKFKNLLNLYFLVLLIAFILPVFHFILFSIDRNNYSYNEEYLRYQNRILENEIELYSDYAVLEELLGQKNDSILNSKVENLQVDSVINIGIFSLKVKKRPDLARPVDRGHDGYEAKTIDIARLTRPNEIVGSFNIIDVSIKSAIEIELAERNELMFMIKNPINFVRFKDVWLECTSGFLLGNLKPISSIAQFFQLIQIFILFIIATIIGNSLGSSKRLTITKINI